MRLAGSFAVGFALLLFVTLVSTQPFPAHTRALASPRGPANGTRTGISAHTKQERDLRERGTEKEVAREGQRAIERERERERRDPACARVRVCARNLTRVRQDFQQKSRQSIAAAEQVCSS